MFSASFNYKIHYLCPELVSDSLSAIRIKRESGVNPGQSRCCEALFQHSETYYCHWSISYKPGRLQDGSQSEDLPFVKGCFSSWVRKAVRKKFLI